ncbi:MAG: thermonuclease family protein [Betaproteobacteria bacterium]|nr:thermonuclease family protein [Betaproteobacteria bacterium]
MAELLLLGVIVWLALGAAHAGPSVAEAAPECWSALGVAVRTIDGDSFIARLKIWHGLEVTERIRLLGVDTPERKGPTMAQALQARAFTDRWLGQEPFEVRSCARDSFGRALATVRRGGDDLADKLLEAGLAVPFRR